MHQCPGEAQGAEGVGEGPHRPDSSGMAAPMHPRRPRNAQGAHRRGAVLPTNASPSWRAAPPRVERLGLVNARVHSTDSRPVWAARLIVRGAKEGADGPMGGLGTEWRAMRGASRSEQTNKGRGAGCPAAVIAPIALHERGRRRPKSPDRSALPCAWPSLAWSLCRSPAAGSWVPPPGPTAPLQETVPSPLAACSLHPAALQPVSLTHSDTA